MREDGVAMGDERAVARERLDRVAERCYRERATHLYGYGRRLGLDPSSAEEAVQEVFVRLLHERTVPPDRPRLPRYALRWAASMAAVVVALVLAVEVGLPALESPGVGGTSPSGSTPGAASPTPSPAAWASIAEELGIPASRVLVTEDGAVYVIQYPGEQPQLVLLRGKPPAWTANTIGNQPSPGPSATPTDAATAGGSITTVLCDDPSLVRRGYVFGRADMFDEGTQLALVPGPAIGGKVVDGLYVFALPANVPVGTEEFVTGPVSSTHLTGMPSGTFAADRLPAAITCLAPAH